MSTRYLILRQESEKQCVWLGGITLNYIASQLVNFDVIKDMILEKREGGHVTVHREKKIKRKRKAGGGVVSIITGGEIVQNLVF